MKKEENMKRENEDSFLNEKLKNNSFTVPENYFDELQEITMASKAIADIATEHNFKVPENYFDTLRTQIIAQSKITDSLKKDSFETPENYFENLDSRILSKTLAVKKAKVFNLNFMRYAAAAMMMLATTFGFYFYHQNNQSVSKQLSQIPEQDIVEYLEVSSDPNDMSYIIDNTSDLSTLEENMSKKITN